MPTIADEIATLDAVYRQDDLSRPVCADLLSRRRALYAALHPNAIRHGGSRRRWKFHETRIPSFVEDTSAKLGISHSTIRRLLHLADTTETIDD